MNYFQVCRMRLFGPLSAFLAVKYRRRPKIWELRTKFDTEHPITIPSSRVESLGHGNSADDPDWIRDPHDTSNLLALPEYAVQLGCLNFLRQVGYRSDRDFTYLKSFQGDDSLVWARAYQCIERLRHAIMNFDWIGLLLELAYWYLWKCWGDVGAVTLL